MRHLLAALLATALAACALGPTAKDRKTAEIHNDLAVEALRAGRWADASKEYDLALASDDRMADAWYGKGLVLGRAFGRNAEAEKALRKAVELRPGFSEAWTELGSLFAAAGRTDEAVKAFDKALDNMLYKEPWVARCNKGWTLFQASRRDEGLAELRSCVKVAPRWFCEARRLHGQALLADGKSAEAVGELQAGATACPRSPDLQLQLGLARMKTGDAVGAREAFERCRELGGEGPEGEECRRSLAILE